MPDRFPAFGVVVFWVMLCTACHHPDADVVNPPDGGGPCPPLSQGEIYACHSATDWNEYTTHNALLGKWQWAFTGCFWTPSDATCQGLSAFTVEFLANDSLFVRENGIVIQAARWNLVPNDSQHYKINAIPSVSEIYGQILICQDLVEFNDSYIDGCDNVFRKLE